MFIVSYISRPCLCFHSSAQHLCSLILLCSISCLNLLQKRVLCDRSFTPVTEKSKRLINCTDSETKLLFLIQADEDNSTVFKGHIQWLAWQSLLVFWSSCLNDPLTVKSQNTTAPVNSMFLYLRESQSGNFTVIYRV